MSPAGGFPTGAPAWVDLVSSDPEGARAFYGELFGWDFDIGGPETGRYTYCLSKGSRAAGMVGQAVETMPPAWTTYLATDDADATAQRITDAGGSLVMAPVDAGPAGRVVVATDPMGALVGAWQGREHPGAGTTVGHGAVVWNELATTDLDAAATFYSAVFDHEWQEADPADETGTPYRTFSAGRRLAGGATTAGGQPLWRPYFGVRHLAEAVATVERRGGSVIAGRSWSPYGMLAHVTDPQGAAFSLLEQVG